MKGAREGAWVNDEEYAAKRIALLRRWITESGTPKLFSASCRADLGRLRLSQDDILLIEAMCEINEYRDSTQHGEMRNRVSVLLRKQGIRLPRGKRSRPEIQAFVEGVSGTLRDLGVRNASGDNSRAVLILRRIAEDLGLQGDPRQELRRIMRTSRQLSAQAQALVFSAISRGLKGLDP